MCVRKSIVTAVLAAAVMAAAPRNASADWVLTPFVGFNFKGTADVSDTAGVSLENKLEKKINYGASLTAMGGGAVGFEVDFGYSPNFFETGTATNGDFDFTNDSNVTTLTANAIVGAPMGGVRPYVVGGVGLIRSNVGDAGDFFDVKSKNDLGFDV